jgi:hypothetical protein
VGNGSGPVDSQGAHLPEEPLFFRFGQTQIETEAAEITKKSVGADINLRKERKREVVQSYVDDKAPWHKKNVHILDIEVISWDKILKDAKMRSQIFFQKLGI